ncbi:hypothetical protein EJ06DRAFT_530402 [Trichodelitschia bisporula]|uniref:Uncharacterized protein n=1 Tax=Trichodelitschia bisporula TaxID=703511 RepID=A0A6G1HWV9_9PEZI|nr:hypothetical protein EJ06DRAFT_530402 [Trichodelitschia bisporula]
MRVASCCLDSEPSTQHARRKPKCYPIAPLPAAPFSLGWGPAPSPLKLHIIISTRTGN